MAVHLSEIDDGRLLEVQASGRLSKRDYQEFVPELERLIQKYGKVRVLFEMADFHGWNPGGVWEDLKFDVRHFSDIERLALVGDKRWQQWMAKFCRPFTKAEIRYFDHAHERDAREWIGAKAA